MAYFSARVSLLGKGSFRVGVISMPLQADAVVSEDLPADCDICGMVGMIAGFVNINVLVHGEVWMYWFVGCHPTHGSLYLGS